MKKPFIVINNKVTFEMPKVNVPVLVYTRRIKSLLGRDVLIKGIMLK